MHVECKDNGDTSSNRKHLKIIHKISDQHTWKEEIKELQKIAILVTMHILLERTYVRVQTIYHEK